ncbi:hypothetical protein [Streptomyces sp. NEAU-H3]|uniref:hypothetical protein n=1 Tax=Streptomyces sp. NEAU-H3 TaxID=2720636 RepID=UPI00143B719C|nr:hypothetical protein [Streptomyces sp. NEAU-H3]NJA56711.1 hypothetical protein [Streptomyces sp. NEAU-H3]
MELARRIEAIFLGYGRTLTDTDDAEGYEIAMGIVLVMLDGARARGVIDDAQHAELTATFEETKRAPRHL